MTVHFSCDPTVASIVKEPVFTSTAPSIEKVIPNEENSQANYQKQIITLRGGANEDEAAIFLITALCKKNNLPVELFLPNLFNLNKQLSFCPY